MTVSTAMYTVDVKVAIGVKKQAAIVAETLERILPYNMIFTVELLYNTWAMTRPHTWGALTSRTWKSIKEEVEA